MAYYRKDPMRKAVHDILVMYTRINKRSEWDKRVYFLTTLERVRDSETDIVLRVGPQEAQHRLHPDIPLFTDADITCNRQWFFLLLADALSGEDTGMEDWLASPMQNARGRRSESGDTDWAFSWTHAGDRFTFYSKTMPPMPPVWYVQKIRDD